jgi:hypothetical protein
MGYPNVRAATFTLAIVLLWPILSKGQTAQDVGTLTRAGKCDVQGHAMKNGENATFLMVVQNDGGWCWDNVWWSPQKGRYLAARDVTVIDPPKYGHVVIGDRPNYRVRIAYQPESDFTGEDKYTVHYNVAESDVTYSVTISK